MNFRISFLPSAPAAKSSVNSLAKENLSAVVSANRQHAIRVIRGSTHA